MLSCKFVHHNKDLACGAVPVLALRVDESCIELSIDNISVFSI